MKSAGVFLGGLTSVLACNLMLIGVCSSSPVGLAPAASPPPPPVPPPVVRVVRKPAEIPSEPVPLGIFFWGCGSHLSVDPDGVIALPMCAPLRGL